MPAVGDVPGQQFRAYPRHGDDAHRDARHRHDEVLQHLRKDDREHPALDDVDRRGGRNDQPVVDLVQPRVGRQFPGQEHGGELPDTDEPVGYVSNHDDDGEGDHDEVAQLRPRPLSEPKLNPLRPRHHSRPAEPDGQEDHQEDLVERWPQPGDEDALQAVDEKEREHPHRPADVEHPRGVAQAQGGPGDLVAPQEVALQVPAGALGNVEADDERRQDVTEDDGNVDPV